MGGRQRRLRRPTSWPAGLCDHGHQRLEPADDHHARRARPLHAGHVRLAARCLRSDALAKSCRNSACARLRNWVIAAAIAAAARFWNELADQQLRVGRVAHVPALDQDLRERSSGSAPRGRRAAAGRRRRHRWRSASRCRTGSVERRTRAKRSDDAITLALSRHRDRLEDREPAPDGGPPSAWMSIATFAWALSRIRARVFTHGPTPVLLWRVSTTFAPSALRSARR